LFHALLFQRQGPYHLIWPLLHLKPPRLTKVRTETMSKIQKKKLACRHLLLPSLPKISMSTRRGNVSTKLLHRVLQQLVKPLLMQKIWSTSIC
jgi:hypothetical protein